MAKTRAKRTTGKIFENILFLAEVFGDQADRDIPKLPVLEMARCFDLQVPGQTTPAGAGANPGRYGNSTH